MAISGNFTKPENLHLTLEFMGEIDNDGIIRLKKLVRDFFYQGFVIQTRNMGFFSNRGSNDILVWNIEKSSELAGLVGVLREKLRNMNFQVDDREYRPHFTIARQIRLTDGARDMIVKTPEPTMFMQCDRLSLMESARVNGNLLYREIVGIDFFSLAEETDK